MGESHDTLLFYVLYQQNFIHESGSTRISRSSCFVMSFLFENVIIIFPFSGAWKPTVLRRVNFTVFPLSILFIPDFSLSLSLSPPLMTQVNGTCTNSSATPSWSETPRQTQSRLGSTTRQRVTRTLPYLTIHSRPRRAGTPDPVSPCRMSTVSSPRTAPTTPPRP